jgi:hypothetical protein
MRDHVRSAWTFSESRASCIHSAVTGSDLGSSGWPHTLVEEFLHRRCHLTEDGGGVG